VGGDTRVARSAGKWDLHGLDHAVRRIRPQGVRTAFALEDAAVVRRMLQQQAALLVDSNDPGALIAHRSSQAISRALHSVLAAMDSR
jgi:hypothetical protein